MSFDDLIQLQEKEIQDKFKQYLEEEANRPNDGSTSLVGIFKAGYIAAKELSGNQYTGYLKEGNKTLEKIHPDEPIFILRAQDNTAPEIVQYWIARNLDTVDEAKLKEAFQVVLAMRRYSSRRDPT